MTTFDPQQIGLGIILIAFAVIAVVAYLIGHDRGHARAHADIARAERTRTQDQKTALWPLFELNDPTPDTWDLRDRIRPRDRFCPTTEAPTEEIPITS